MKKKTGLTGPKLWRVFALVEENICRPITLGMMADAAAMSRYHFARSFKKATGLTPARYVWSRRISCAQKRLASTDDLLLQIAFTCGFASQSHLSSAFKEATGVPPSRYRARLTHG